MLKFNAIEYTLNKIKIFFIENQEPIKAILALLFMSLVFYISFTMGK